jgi:hypothetical protein
MNVGVISLGAHRMRLGNLVVTHQSHGNWRPVRMPQSRVGVVESSTPTVARLQCLLVKPNVSADPAKQRMCERSGFWVWSIDEAAK